VGISGRLGRRAHSRFTADCRERKSDDAAGIGRERLASQAATVANAQMPRARPVVRGCIRGRASNRQATSARPRCALAFRRSYATPESPDAARCDNRCAASPNRAQARALAYGVRGLQDRTCVRRDRGPWGRGAARRCWGFRRFGRIFTRTLRTHPAAHRLQSEPEPRSR
jgi:hypothetical protein